MLPIRVFITYVHLITVLLLVIIEILRLCCTLVLSPFSVFCVITIDFHLLSTRLDKSTIAVMWGNGAMIPYLIKPFVPSAVCIIQPLGTVDLVELLRTAFG